MISSQHSPLDPRIAEEATQWLIELEGNSADEARFTDWLIASPRHVEEFLLASAVWSAVSSIDDARRIDVDQLVARARANVQPLDTGTSSTPRRRDLPRRMGVWLGAAVAVFAITCVMWLGINAREERYATGIGEQRAVKLSDGSVVTLNTRSAIAVRFADHVRLVELLAGEALFDVQHDPQRPFRVVAGVTQVEAVGTQFNVHRADAGTTVSVVEGIVKVSPVDAPPNDTVTSSTASDQRFKAGEQAQVSPQGTLERRAPAEIERVMAWRERRLVFRDEPLVVIAAEFNRYNTTQLSVEGSATRSRRMTGVFNADEPDALVAFLKRDPVLSVQSREGNVVIRGP